MPISRPAVDYNTPAATGKVAGLGFVDRDPTRHSDALYAAEGTKSR